jgi:sec-independent protein translocase protein TatC
VDRPPDPPSGPPDPPSGPPPDTVSRPGPGDAGGEERPAPDDPSPDDRPAPETDDAVMPFLAHLEELRRTLLHILGAVGGGAVVCWAFSGTVLTWLIASTSGSAIFIKPQGAFLARLKVALVMGLLLTLPYVFYKIWVFVGPGLLARERRVVLPGAVGSVLLFYLGLVFSYFVMTPLMVKVLLGFGTATLTAQTEVHFLLDLVFMMGLASGLVFQMPLFAAFLTTVGILAPHHLKRYWRHSLVGIFILAALLTPADPLSQIVLAIPLLLLYWVSYFLSLIIHRRKHAAGA